MKAGDRVWFFFRHAYGAPEITPSGHEIEMFTGMMEMRCRPATVVEVVHGTPERRLPAGRMTIPIQGTAPLHLDVDFDPFVEAHDGLEPGKIGRGWPCHRRWAYEPHASAKTAAMA